MQQITAEVRDEMFAHAVRCQPNEACGMVSVRQGSSLVDEFHPMANAAESPTVFRLDGQEFLDLEAAVAASGRELVGIMHSHVTTSAYPSPTDRGDSASFDPLGTYRHLIVSLRADDPVMRCYELVDQQVTEIELVCVAELPDVDDGSPIAVAAVQQLRPPTQ